MPFSDLATEFIAAWNLDETKVLWPSRLVFLCGGEIDLASPVPVSARDALMRTIPDRQMLGPARIILAEAANGMLAESHFDNLLDLEEYMAALVDAVILFVESPGSICELGSFSGTSEITQKLRVFVMNEHGIRASFIVNGPLRYLGNVAGTNRVSLYDWSIDGRIATIPAYALTEMVQECSEITSDLPAAKKFNRDERGHQIYTILAIAFILRGGLLSEIKRCARIIWPSISDKDVRKSLDALHIAGLIKPISNGPKRVHFVPILERINMAIVLDKGPVARDPLRWLTDVLEAIREEDEVRISIFQRHNDAA